MLRLTHLVPLTTILLAVAPACSDDGKDTPSGTGGDKGDRGGAQNQSGTAGNVAGSSVSGGGGSSGGGGGTMMVGGTRPVGGEGGGEHKPDPVDCSKLSAIPATFETFSGFTSSEDFVFDARGNYVGVDEDGNLVRVSKMGKKELWAPNIGTTAGMAILPDGSVVIADVGNGALKRVYENGSSVVVIGGLLYPNGLDIGPDGFIYVAENDAGRVRRVDPDSGAFSIVAMGLQGANGVAFGSDPKLMYVGSFEGSGVYKVEIPAPGQLGTASIFAKPNGSMLLEPALACPEQKVGKDCMTSTREEPGKCQQLSNVVDCVPTDPCETKPDAPGCAPENVCKDKKAGDECEDPLTGPGTCKDIVGQLECVPANGCEGKADGTSCDFFGESGTCLDQECNWNSCSGASAGAACQDELGGPGTCAGAAKGALECVNPCQGKSDGAACTAGGQSGQCLVEFCALTCNAKNANLPCQVDGELGWCRTNDQGQPVCDLGGGSAGGIDGLGVDACGNVYASEFSTGNVWRISAAGKVEKLAKLPSGWIPNIKWGRGMGGFARDVMFVADRDKGRLFGVAVGVPGAPEYYDIARP